MLGNVMGDGNDLPSSQVKEYMSSVIHTLSKAGSAVDKNIKEYVQIVLFSES